MEITLKNLQKKVPIPRGRILKAARAALRTLMRDRHSLFLIKNSKKIKSVCPLLSIVFVGTKRMRAINKKYLGHDYVTDVLTFDLGENIGEIIICPRIARAQAQAHQTTTENEIILYVIHGILHLGGFDDRRSKDKIKMRFMEKELLKGLDSRFRGNDNQGSL